MRRRRMKVSVLTDEISEDPATAIELASGWGIRHVEIRSLFGKRVPDEDPDVRKILVDSMSAHDVDVAAITPGLFKVPLTDRERIDRHLADRLPKSIEFANAVGTDVIILFTPVLIDGPDEKAMSYFRDVLVKALDIAEKEAVTLALENEPICYTATGSSTSKFVRDLNRQDLRVNWDPGNAYFAGEDALEGYRHVRDLVAHVHLKDCVTDRLTGAKGYVPIGQGEVGLEEQVRLLKEDRYLGHLTIETHFGPKVKGTKECLDGLRAILSRLGEGLE